MPIIQQLKNSVLFKEASEDSLKKLEKACALVAMSPGQTLFYEGDDAQSFFVVKAGTLVIKKSSKAGEEDLARIGSGSYIGEMTLLNSNDGKYDKRTASAEAVEDTTLVEVPFKIIEELIASDVKFGMLFYRAIARNLSSRIQKTAEDLTSLKSLHLKHL